MSRSRRASSRSRRNRSSTNPQPTDVAASSSSTMISYPTIAVNPGPPPTLHYTPATIPTLTVGPESLSLFPSDDVYGCYDPNLGSPIFSKLVSSPIVTAATAVEASSSTSSLTDYPEIQELDLLTADSNLLFVTMSLAMMNYDIPRVLLILIAEYLNISKKFFAPAIDANNMLGDIPSDIMPLIGEYYADPRKSVSIIKYTPSIIDKYFPTVGASEVDYKKIQSGLERALRRHQFHMKSHHNSQAGARSYSDRIGGRLGICSIAITSDEGIHAFSLGQSGTHYFAELNEPIALKKSPTSDSFWEALELEEPTESVEPPRSNIVRVKFLKRKRTENDLTSSSTFDILNGISSPIQFRLPPPVDSAATLLNTEPTDGRPAKRLRTDTFGLLSPTGANTAATGETPSASVVARAATPKK